MGKASRKGSNADLRTKERLLNAALIEFTDIGYFLTNADAIAKRAGVGHGTFYLYFKSKNEALAELLLRALDSMPYTAYRGDIKYLLRKVHDRSDLEAAILELFEPMQKSSGLLKALVQSMLQDKDIFLLANEIQETVTRVLSAIIVALQKKGRHKGYDARILAEFITICLLSSFLMLELGIVTGSLEALAHTLSGIISPVLFSAKQTKTPAEARPIIPENDAKIRRDILEAAKAEFIAHGYFDAKITHITRKAGYSRGTFYLYYKDKEDLMESIFYDMMGRMNQGDNLTIDSINVLDISSLDALVGILTKIVNIFDAPINWSLTQGFFYSPKLSRFYNDMFTLYSEPIVNKITALQAKGHCRDIDPQLAAPIVLATVSYSAFLRGAQVISCTKRKYALTMAWFLYTFINHP
ncbi:MAG: TetR/AcrR family transcriptional regulator [Syntrophaceae bacterium]